MKRISWNSPVVLWFTALSGVSLLLGFLTGGRTTQTFFTVYRSSFSDPLTYLRLFTHVLGHADFSHYSGNMVIFLLVGPLLEEKYGSKRLLEIILLVALVTGLVHILISPRTGLLGASGVDFAFILLASVSGNRASNKIPLTLLIAAAFYLGQEIYTGIAVRDNISQITHILGGSIGAVYGLSMHPGRKH